MSVFTYTTNPDPEHFPYADAVKPIAVEHHRVWDRETRESAPPVCGHSDRGAPDTTLQALPPECEAAGCRVGYTVEQHRGRVVRTWERNGYDDSDFLAECITDLETLETATVTYASTRGWTYFNSATADLPGGLRARLEAAREADAAARRAKADAEKADLDAKLPAVGDTARVKSKRSKIPHGTEGRVCWFGKSGYQRPDYYANPHRGMLRGIDPNMDHPARNLGDYRVGIETADGRKLYASATVFEVVAKAEGVTR